MNKLEIEQKIVVLKGKQSAHFSKKKAERNAEELQAIREELNALKAQVRVAYRTK